MKLLIFGTGLYYQNRKENFINEDIVAFVDNNSSKWGTSFEDREIISPERICEMDYDFVCLMAKGEFVEQMRRQLEQLRVPYEKIIDFFEYKATKEERQLLIYYGNSCSTEGKKKILLLTHELSYSGAPLVLFDVARVLKKNGYFVGVLSLRDGELRKDFIREGIMVGIQEDIRRFDTFFFNWFQQFDLVWGNTVTYYYWIEAFSRTSLPFVWWLHESKEAYEWLGTNRMPRYIADNIHVYAVGSLAMRDANKYIPNAKINTLLYGAPDFSSEILEELKSNEKIVFAIIGSINPRKAQDIFVEAIESLTEAERQQSEFWIIGNVLQEEFFEKLKERIVAIPEIKILGSFNREEMKAIYSKLDVVVCPSREDPLPVVATEAMIMSKPCVVSTETGTAALIEDEVNGLICEVENVQSLADKMRWCIQNQNKLTVIGRQARKLYEEQFSMEVFEKNVCKIVDDAIKM